MKKITITVSVDGNEVSRDYRINLENEDYYNWGNRIIDMLQTIEHSNDPIPEIPGFEGTAQNLELL